MRPDERVSVPEQAVDSPYDRPTAPSGIPVATPPPRQAEAGTAPPAFESAAPADSDRPMPADTRPVDVDKATPADVDRTNPADVDTVDLPETSESSEAPEADTAEPVDSDSAELPEEVFGAKETERLRGRWRELQADFVDDPERAVHAADQLVGEVLAAITEHKRALDEIWHAGDTEQLRVALRRYRTFLDRLLEA
jgi:hypothetical protein